MVEYVIGFEEEFSRDIYERRNPDAMNMYEAEELQAQATTASVELLTTLGYAAQVDPKGMIKVDRPIDSDGLEAIRKMFDEFRVTTWDHREDKGAVPLLIQERPLEKLAEIKPSK